MASAYIALGSNVGDRRVIIQSALDALRALEGIEVIAVSDLIETDPQGGPPQGRYINAVAGLSSDLAPRELLESMLRIEQAHDRDRRFEQHWGPRPLDLDLLLYGDRLIDEPGLTVPHPRMHERAFVLEPLTQIAPKAFHPRLRQTAQALYEHLPVSPAGGIRRG